MLRLLFVILMVATPSIALAGGANVKTGIGDKNGPECAPGFYFDKLEGMCIAANWL